MAFGRQATRRSKPVEKPHSYIYYDTISIEKQPNAAVGSPDDPTEGCGRELKGNFLLKEAKIRANATASALLVGRDAAVFSASSWEGTHWLDSGCHFVFVSFANLKLFCANTACDFA